MVEEILSSLSAINKEISSITHQNDTAASGAELSSRDVLNMDFSDLSNDIFMRRPKSSHSISNNHGSSSTGDVVLRSSSDNVELTVTAGEAAGAATNNLPPKAEPAPRAKSAPATRKSSSTKRVGGGASVNTSINSSIESFGSADLDDREAAMTAAAAKSPTLFPEAHARVSAHPASSHGIYDEFAEEATESSPFSKLSPDTVRTSKTVGSTTSSITLSSAAKKSIRKQQPAVAPIDVTDDIFSIMKSPSSEKKTHRPMSHDSKYAQKVRVTVEKGKEGLLEYSPKAERRSASAGGRGREAINYDFLDADNAFGTEVMQTDVITDSFSIKLGDAPARGKMLKPNKKLAQKALLKGGLFKKKV